MADIEEGKVHTDPDEFSKPPRYGSYQPSRDEGYAKFFPLPSRRRCRLCLALAILVVGFLTSTPYWAPYGVFRVTPPPSAPVTLPALVAPVLVGACFGLLAGCRSCITSCWRSGGSGVPGPRMSSRGP